MQVATIIVHYQNLQDTLRCVESLKQLDYRDNLIIIVDSCSPNKTGLQLKQLLPELTVILSPDNNGFAAACNLGIEHARKLGADCIWLLNPDTTVAYDALSQLVNASVLEPDFIAYGSKIFYGDRPNIIWSAGAKIDFKNRTLEMLGNAQNDSKEYAINRTDCDYLPGCSIFARIEVFEIMLPEEYFMYFEETDWCQQVLRSSGKKFLLVANSYVYHFSSDDKMQSAFNVYYYNRNQLMFWYKFASPIERVAILAVALFRALPRNIYAYLKAPSEQLKTTFRAHLLSVVDFILGRSGKRFKLS